MLDSAVELASAKASHGNRATTTATIPIVFFGRLEERKGLCTFLEAIRLLSPDIWPYLRLSFMGKVVSLYSEALCHLNSQEYIAQELGTEVQYEICPDLFSQEAIQRVRETQPIVCLTSPQENFPNSALEMGQLPVGLVVSKTGGFEETLALVKRTDGVYWFTPGNAVSLAAALQEAIAHYPQTYPVATPDELAQVNADLLEDKLQHIEQAFQRKASAPEVAAASISIGLVCAELVPSLLETLSSVVAGDAAPETIVLHGEATTETARATLSQVKTQFPEVRLISLGRSIHTGAAWNQLPSVATGDYCLILEPGWTLLPGGLDTFRRAVGRSPAPVITCPRWSHGEAERLVAFRSGTVASFMQIQHPGNLPVLVARSFLQRYPLPEVRDLEISGWAMLAGAIATGNTPVCCPYPLVQSPPETEQPSGLATPRQQYYLRLYLNQIPLTDWSPRQFSMILAALQYTSEANLQSYFATQKELMSQKIQQRQQRLHEVQLKVHRTHKRIASLEAQLAEAEARIQAYEGSKLWKLRQWWQRLKRSLNRGDA